MATESVQFFLEYVAPGGGSPGPYTVPGGFLAVVTDVQVVTAAAGRQLGAVAVYTNVGTFTVAQFDSAELQLGQWRGRVAVPAGDTIDFSVLANTAGVTVSVSGYLYS